MPRISPLATTKTAPTSLCAIDFAASATVVSGATVTICVSINDPMIAIASPLGRRVYATSRAIAIASQDFPWRSAITGKMA
jgi:hypothetical protein